VKRSLRVCLIPTDTWGVGSYRCLLPGRELERRGHDVFSYFDADALKDWHPTEGNRPLRNAIPVLGERLAGLRDPRSLPAELPEDFDADVYVFQRRFEWWMPWAVARLRALGKTVVCEVDDLYDDLPATSPGAKPFLKYPATLDKDGWPPLNGFSVEKFNESLGFASLVTVSTPALAEHYSRYADRVEVLPNYLDWSMWEDVVPQCEVERPRPRIGWMGWLAWRDTDLAVLREFMHDWLLDHPDVEFVSIGEKPGSKMVHDYLRVPREQRRSVPGVPFSRLNEIVPTIDIGLVPLTHGPFNECKSWLKGLEYSACGVVPVATPTQQYREFIRDGVDGHLADTPDQWAARLHELVTDDGLRRQMGRAARAKASRMTIQREVGQWEDLYLDALTDRGGALASLSA
jgi:glycosyltransferase involved in cell wall biosynthesis